MYECGFQINSAPRRPGILLHRPQDDLAASIGLVSSACPTEICTRSQCQIENRSSHEALVRVVLGEKRNRKASRIMQPEYERERLQV